MIVSELVLKVLYHIDRESSKYRRALNELYWWEKSNDPGRYSDMVYELIKKADEANSIKMLGSFAIEMAAYDDWKTTVFKRALFARHSVPTSVKENTNDL